MPLWYHEEIENAMRFLYIEVAIDWHLKQWGVAIISYVFE